MHAARRSRVLGIVAVALMLAGCTGLARPSIESQAADDITLAAEVKAALIRMPAASAATIDVEAEQGVVRLRGVVDTETQRRRAARLAREVPGVVQVRNEITVK